MNCCSQLFKGNFSFVPGVGCFEEDVAVVTRNSNKPVNDQRRRNAFNDPDVPFLFSREIIPHGEIGKK